MIGVEIRWQDKDDINHYGIIRDKIIVEGMRHKYVVTTKGGYVYILEPELIIAVVNSTPNKKQ